MYAAIVANIGISAALTVRARSGQGQRVEAPLFDSFMQSVGILGMAEVPFRKPAAASFGPWDHQFLCADGRWVHIVCVEPKHTKLLASLIDRPELCQLGLFDPESSRTREEHETIRPQAAGLTVSVDDAALGTTAQPAPIVAMSHREWVSKRPAPAPDEHRDELWSELSAANPFEGGEAARISPAANIGPPLRNVRVLDLSIVLAGPTCGRTLAELGADVIKINDPKRSAVAFHRDVNRGKRSILLDLSRPEGLDVFWELVEQSDVILENFRSGVPKRLGIDYESVKARRPDIIYGSMTAFGSEGQWAEHPG